MNQQELFTKAYLGIKKHGFSFDSHANECRYRLSGNATDPIRCGIGHCILDELYNPTMEGCGIWDGFVSTYYPELFAHFGLVALRVDGDDANPVGECTALDDGIQFLQDLQDAHDEAALGTETGDISSDTFDQAIAVFETAMEDIADKYNLSFPEAA